MKAIEDEIKSVVKLQVELDLDVLVHGEPEVRSVEFSHNENYMSNVFEKKCIQSKFMRILVPMHFAGI